MARYLIQYNRMRNSQSDLALTSKKLAALQSRLNTVTKAMDTRDSGMASVCAELKSSANRISPLGNRVASSAAALVEIAAVYEKSEKNLLQKFLDWVTGLFKKKTGKGTTITTDNNSPGIGSNPSAPPVTLKENPNRYDGTLAEDSNYVKTKDGTRAYVCTHNDAEKKIESCAYHTLKQLRKNGVEYPFLTKGTGGGQWFNNCDPELVDKYPGANGISDLLTAHGNPAYNIVVDMKDHVMVIDKIENEQVFFTEHRDNFLGEMYKRDSVYPKEYKQGTQISLPMEAFRYYYEKYNSPINGYVHLGK